MAWGFMLSQSQVFSHSSELVFWIRRKLAWKTSPLKVAFERLCSDPVLQLSDCDNQYILAIVLFIIVCCLSYQHSVPASEFISLITNDSSR